MKSDEFITDSLYQSMLNETQTAVYACDCQTYDIIYLNHKMAEFCGVNRNSALGEKCYKYFFHKDTPCSFCKMNHIKKGVLITREFSYPGTENTYDMKGTILEWNDKIVHVEYIQDITDAKRAEAENTQLTQQLKSIMDNVPGALCLYQVTDKGIEPVIHNKAFFKIFGYSEENAKLVDEKTDFLNVHPDDLEELQQKVIQAVETSTSMEHTYRFYNDKKQSYIWLNLNAVIIKGTDGRKLCYASYADVTEERKRQQELLKVQKKIEELQLQAQHTLQEYQMLVNTIPGAIVVYEVIDGRIATQYYSDGLCKLTGYTREERDFFSKENALNLIDERDVPYVSNAVEAAIHTKSDLNLTYRIKCKNAQSRYIRLNATYVLNERKRPEFHAVFLDIDEMKQLEQENENQQLRYGVAIKSSGINVWEYDIQNDRLTVVSNSSRIKQNCYTIDNYVASTVNHGYVREDSLSTFYSIFERLREGEKEITEDIWYKTTDEAGWWCERVIYTTVFDENNMPIKAFGAGRDVTREKDAVRKFQEEMNYRAAIQETSIGSMKINLTKNEIIEGKSSVPIVMQWIKQGNAEQYFNNNAQYILEGEARQRYQKKFNRFALIEQFNGGEYTVSDKITRKLPGSTIRWLQYNIHLMKNPENNDVVAFVASHDITDEQVMKMIMDTVTKADFERVVVVDGINNSATDYSHEQEVRRFVYNQVFEDRLEELIRENVVEEDVERIVKNCKIKNILSKIKDGKDYKINYSIHEKNGELRRKQLQFTSMHKEQKTFLMARIDVNEVFVEQERAKEKLQNALHTAQRAANAKTEFLSRMSHDMRTPMNGIIGLTQLSKDIPNLPKEMQDNLASIEDSSKYLLSLINDTLDMNKIESKKIVLNYEVVKARTLLKNILGFVAPLANAKHITIESIPINAELEHIYIDRMRVEQIFVNILSNAIKFTPSGGKIRMEIECLKRENGIAYDRISIEDNGIGMSADFLPKAFEPFAQESTAITSNYAGTGLGLSIVKNIVELMGGQIQIESELGKGTKVTIYLNFKRVYDYEDKPTKYETNAMNILQGRHILLCEDHPLNAQIATKLLESKGIIVTHAENGEIGLEMVQKSEENQFDAILMDIRMPVMDGLEATRHIRSLDSEYAKQIPIIAMTANAFDTDRKNSKAAGMTDHLAKPIEPKLLFETLAKYME